MGSRSRFARPDTKRLPLSDGDWIEVRKRLTAGDQRQAFARLVKTAAIDGDSQGDEQTAKVELDPSQVGLSTVLAYLVDWSLSEMPIKGESLDVVTSALDALDAEDYNEIQKAVTQHEKAMKAERDQEKKDLAGAMSS